MHLGPFDILQHHELGEAALVEQLADVAEEDGKVEHAAGGGVGSMQRWLKDAGEGWEICECV